MAIEHIAAHRLSRHKANPILLRELAVALALNQLKLHQTRPDPACQDKGDKKHHDDRLKRLANRTFRAA